MIGPGAVTFLWPTMLWLLVLAPTLVALYLWLLARRKRAALRYASLALVGEAMSAPGRVRRHVPALLLFLGLCAMLLAVARPHAVIMLPAHQQTVMLAMDASGSMRATDVKPNRLAAAQEAAKAFIAEQPRHVRIGIVAIAAAAAVVQSPTHNREDLVQAIDRFQLQRGSAIGSGLIISLATLLPDAGIDVEQLVYGRTSRWWLDSARKSGTEKAKPVPPGSNGSAAIVLLTDGQSNVGPAPLEAAKLAAERGVRVFTVGLGTVEGTTLGFEGWSMRVRLDEDMLKKIATMTGGDYFQARNAADLKTIYRHLNVRLGLEKKRSTEVTAIFVAIGAALAILGAMLSLFWFNRIL
jgi:Ca-activated chloride channel family protein